MVNTYITHVTILVSLHVDSKILQMNLELLYRPIVRHKEHTKLVFV